jgi:protein SCO1/2
MKFFDLITAFAVVALASGSLAAETITLLSNKPTCCTKELQATKPLTDRSLYQVESSWTNDAGVALKLSSLAGRPQIISMFFASCQFTCPILVNDMKQIEAALPENVRTNVGFVLVSFDSERDTPAALARYRVAHGLTGNWTLLRGRPDDVLELGALLGMKFKKDPRGDFSHSNVITVLNSDGEIAGQIVGLNRDPKEIIKLLSEQPLQVEMKK